MTTKYLESCEGTQPAHYLRSSKGTGRILALWEHDLQNESYITLQNYSIPCVDCHFVLS